MKPQPPAQLIAVAEASRRTSRSRTTIWLMIRAGKIPEPTKITASRSAYIEAEVIAWIEVATPASTCFCRRRGDMDQS